MIVTREDARTHTTPAIVKSLVSHESQKTFAWRRARVCERREKRTGREKERERESAFD